MRYAVERDDGHGFAGEVFPRVHRRVRADEQCAGLRAGDVLRARRHGDERYAFLVNRSERVDRDVADVDSAGDDCGRDRGAVDHSLDVALEPGFGEKSHVARVRGLAGRLERDRCDAQRYRRLCASARSERAKRRTAQEQCRRAFARDRGRRQAMRLRKKASSFAPSGMMRNSSKPQLFTWLSTRLLSIGTRNVRVLMR